MEFFMYKNVKENNSKESYKNIEKYRYQNINNIYVQEQNVEPMSTPMLMLVFIIYLVLGIYAAKLSWYSNSKAGWSNGYKVLFAIIAFMFPVSYITAHIVFKLDLLQRIKTSSRSSF
jgi:hypothetical protein